ncbi:MAG: DUF7305 domain-containing protein [Planctomycetota bacterium]|jgi:choice-of-anchor A domain-containing protein
MKKTVKPKEKGSAIIMVMIAMVLLFVVGGGLLRIGLQSQLRAIHTASEIQARCAVDSALVEAVFEMNEKLKTLPWDDTFLPEATGKSLPGCEATYSYTVTGDIDSGYFVDAVGTSGNSIRRITAGLKLKSPFEAAIFGDESIVMKNSALVNWYNYRVGEKDLQIGTNSTDAGAIQLGNGATVNGDIVVGMGGDPDVIIDATWATITGDTYSMTEFYESPSVTVPQQLEDLPSGGTITNDTTITGPGKYDGINLGNSKTITIDGPVSLYIVGDIILKNSAELQVVDAVMNPDAYLTLYLGGEVEVKNSGTINNLSGDASKFQLYGLDTCQSIVLKNSSDFHGTIYAPNADVEMKNSADFYGAVIAESFVQHNSAAFNYDASLRDVNTTNWGVHFTVENWSEK